MTVISGSQAELENILQVAKAMCVAARTAPKAKGVDTVITAIVYGNDLTKLADEMEKYSGKWSFFSRDAKNVRSSAAVVLIGIKSKGPSGLDCGGCGCSSCQEFSDMEKNEGLAYTGPNCVFGLLNLGIAIGSSVKIASDHCVDNRVMFSVGAAAKKAGLIEADVVLGIPLSATGKSIYFDRGRVTAPSL